MWPGIKINWNQDLNKTLSKSAAQSLKSFKFNTSNWSDKDNFLRSIPKFNYPNGIRIMLTTFGKIICASDILMYTNLTARILCASIPFLIPLKYIASNIHD